MLRTSSLVAALVLALASLAGCAGQPSPNGASDDAALSANQVNAAQGDFKEHVITAMPASAENQSALGIATWDVFAGADAKSGFVGAVFYASDTNGDVRYAFASNVKTGSVSVAVLEKDGVASADQSVDEANLKALMDDVARLRDTLQPERPPNASSPSNASSGVRTQDEVVVGYPNERALACAVTIAYAALAGMAVGAIVIGAPAVVAGGLGSAIMGSTFVAGGLYAGYQFVTAIPDGLGDDVGMCL